MRRLLFVLLVLAISLSVLSARDERIDSFLDEMEMYLDIGKLVDSEYLPVLHGYYTGFGAAGITSLRYAVDIVLWMMGEGSDFSSFTEKSRFNDWDTIAAISYNSPYPYYFEGLINYWQGLDHSELYANAALMPTFPENGIDFGFLADMSIPELYDLREELYAMEEVIYSEYQPSFLGLPRSERNCLSSYFRQCADGATDSRRAAMYAFAAVTVEPLLCVNWHYAVAYAMKANDEYMSARLLQEALFIFPDNYSFKLLKEGYMNLLEEEK